MSNDSSEYFASQRREIQEHGFIPDTLLANDPDCPVFGINLACAHPFPESVADQYNGLATSLAGLGGELYVYPIWETHITIVTFINFSRQQRISDEKLTTLRAFVEPIGVIMRKLFETELLKPFQLEFQPPVLLRKAVILPVLNPTGEIARIRQRTVELLKEDNKLNAELALLGLNAPGIIHSTIMRFKKAPPDTIRFTADFDAVTATSKPFRITVKEIYLTSETKPYMREGQIVLRFPLAAS